MTWHDHLVMLLHIAAEIEHALMVQYLYAAYSLGGEQVPETHRPMVKRWQDSILAIAKEEMGHLLTVQNILCLVGGPVNLAREDFPWDIQYYPFPFKLEPLTLDSLSCYVFAEMPPDDAFDPPPGRQLPARYREFEDEDKAPIVARVRKRVTRGKPHEVGAFYKEIIRVIADPALIPDSVFQEDTYAIQASWDDWGRGYQPEPRMLDPEGNLVEPQPPKPDANGDPVKPTMLPPPSARAAHVMIERVATRTQAVAALRAITGQGEAPHLESDETGEPSHFERFLEIYQEFERIDGWKPARDVPENPSAQTEEDAGGDVTFIEAPHARHWADLFNVRYRMLLTYLSHTFRLAHVTRADEPSVRAAMMHRVFGEMYNLKTLAGILVRTPRRHPANRKRRDSRDAEFAGPPFEMPYSLRLPPSEGDTWRLHKELLESSANLCTAMAKLLPAADRDGRRYLDNLIDLDRQTTEWIDVVLAGLGLAERHRV